MALLEEDAVLVSTTEDGTTKVVLPISRANNIEGLGRYKGTQYTVGDTVYVDSNMKIALACITGGVTSQNEIDFTNTNAGETIQDGGVVWLAINRGVFVGATSTTNGASGLVPAPGEGDNEKFLCGDGSFKKLDNYIVGLYFATQSQAEAGTDNATVMTPLQTKNAIKAIPNRKVEGIYLGEFANKTVGDLQNVLKEWVANNLNCGAIGIFQAHPNWVKLWKQGDTTSIIDVLSGTQWTVKILSTYGTSSYFMLEIASYVSSHSRYFILMQDDKWGVPKKVTADGSMPTENKIAITPPASGGDILDYFAPADGYVVFRVNGSHKGRYIYYTTAHIIGLEVELASDVYMGWCPVSKGARVQISLDTYNSVVFLEFVYAQSEV